jgi:hypothetical protein
MFPNNKKKLSFLCGKTDQSEASAFLADRELSVAKNKPEICTNHSMNFLRICLYPTNCLGVNVVLFVKADTPL